MSPPPALVAPTKLDQVDNTTSGNTIVSNSFTPSANALLVVVAVMGSGSSSTSLPASISDTFGLSWTKHLSAEQASATRSATVSIFTAVVGANPSAGTVTVTFASNNVRNTLVVLQVAEGFDAATPVAQTKTGGNETDASLTLTLDSAPAASSLLVAALAGRDGGAQLAGDVEADFTNIALAVGGTSVRRVDYHLNPDDGSVVWSALGIAADTPVVGGLLEIVQAS